MVLTREAIRSGAVREMIAKLAVPMRMLGEEEIVAARQGILRGIDTTGGVWVFGYGSLLWNPAFHFDERRTGTVFGFHRRFCLWTLLGRGCPERPGLVLGLERGGSCRGVAFHIAPADVESELDVVFGRELIGGAYVPRWVPVRTAEGPVRAVTFVINHAHERYARLLPEDRVAEVIATAEGFLGPCADYLINTVDHLAGIGICDRPLERLRARVLALRVAAAEAPRLEA
jgi:glutathione-specific gamma-glutamylcyclotransferase